MAAVGNLDSDDAAELVFIVDDKIVVVNLDGSKDDIEWGQWGHDAGHSNTNPE
jgi:hypothetical protein